MLVGWEGDAHCFAGCNKKCTARVCVTLRACQYEGMVAVLPPKSPLKPGARYGTLSLACWLAGGAAQGHEFDLGFKIDKTRFIIHGCSNLRACCCGKV